MYQQLWGLRVHARDEGGKLRSRNMVTDANGQALPGAGECGRCAVVDLEKFAGVLKEGCAPRRLVLTPSHGQVVA